MNLVGENLSYKLTEELQLRKISFNFEKGKIIYNFRKNTFWENDLIKNNSWTTYAR